MQCCSDPTCRVKQPGYEWMCCIECDCPVLYKQRLEDERKRIAEYWNGLLDREKAEFVRNHSDLPFYSFVSQKTGMNTSYSYESQAYWKSLLKEHTYLLD